MQVTRRRARPMTPKFVRGDGPITYIVATHFIPPAGRRKPTAKAPEKKKAGQWVCVRKKKNGRGNFHCGVQRGVQGTPLSTRCALIKRQSAASTLNTAKARRRGGDDGAGSVGVLILFENLLALARAYALRGAIRGCTLNSEGITCHVRRTMPGLRSRCHALGASDQRSVTV